MTNTKQYILQCLGILLLLCGYFLSDQPDSLSVMHFDPNPACPTVITKGVSDNDIFAAVASDSTPNNTTRKTNVPKYVSFEIILPHTGGYIFHPMPPVIYTCALPERYNYLFYEEINPPPPKAC